MNREEREGMVDRLLNEALATQEMEPRAGLEQRILANLRAQPEPRPWWRWLWAPVAVVLMIVIGVMVTRRPQPLTAPAVVERRPATPTEPAAIRAPAVVTKDRNPSRKASPVPLVVLAPQPVAPRQPAFAPARLTEAERALVALLRSNPEEAKVVADRQAETQQEAAEFMEQAFNPR